jgi:adenylate cyclase
MDDPSQPSSWRNRIEAAFQREQLRSQRLGVRVMTVAFPIIVFWVTFENGVPGAFAFYPLLAVLALVLATPYLLRRAGLFAPWQDYVFAFTYVMLVMTLVFTLPAGELDVSLQVYLTFGNEVYLFVILAGAVFTFSPRVILWTGFASAAAWSAVTLWILLLPDTIADIPDEVLRALGPQEQIRYLTDPHRVHIGKWGRQIVALLTVSAILAAFVRLTRSLVFRQTEAERERANLSRYFSQSMVDELAHTDEPLGPTRSQEVAVLFVDIVGFTAWSAVRTPQAVIEMLRDFHARMEQTIFACGGTVDKYIGDAVMATFGTPRAGNTDATNALRCVRAMIAAVDAWNGGRRLQGLEEIRIGVGAHYGAVVLGDIGGDQRLEFAVLGDTVNVASRLERLTRALGAVAVVSDDLVRATRREADGVGALLADFRPPVRHAVSGRAEAVEVWVLERAG